jgi:hypothetical protein
MGGGELLEASWAINSWSAQFRGAILRDFLSAISHDDDGLSPGSADMLFLLICFTEAAVAAPPRSVGTPG